MTADTSTTSAATSAPHSKERRIELTADGHLIPIATLDPERLAGLLCQTQHISEPEHDLTDRGIRLSHAPRAKAILDIIAAEYAKEEA